MQPSLLIGRETHRDLARLLEARGELTVSGVANETAKAMLLAHFLTLIGTRPTLLVAEDDARTEGLSHWLAFFGCPAVRIPPPVRADGTTDLLSLHAVSRLLQGEGGVFVATRAVFDASFPSFAERRANAVRLREGENCNFTQLIEQLIAGSYSHAADLPLAPGEYRRTGDVLDLFPIDALSPARVSFHFDRIERIATDDRPLTELAVLPVTAARVQELSAQLPRGALLVLDESEDAVRPKGVSCLHFTAFPEKLENHAHLRYLSILKFYTLTDFLNDLRDKLQQEWRILIVSRRAQELASIFREEHVPFTLGAPKNGVAPRAGSALLLPAEKEDLLPHSLQNPDLRSALLTDREIFSLKKAGKQRSIQKLALDFLTSLASGDYVVHMEHGIGRFAGATQKEVDGTPREYLELHYAEGDKLFVPVDQADKLSKYVHDEGDEPVLTRLGTQEWKRVTEKLRVETEAAARELLALYARRAAAKGLAFRGGETELQAFAQAFPYALTPGQEKAIKDIIADMEDTHPMDRLVCGDVGFGKTEVAMRAAYKAVLAGKQVAVVAPITILADQHYHTFTERLKGFPRIPGGTEPVRIEMLSRFRTAREQKVILAKLKKGNVDIVIGTHRLLQPDVAFARLGLVVIDEEQRFGVKQKERFTQMRASLDILTLTATPIPRTLNLGLHKLRDITTITTPPPGRLPIITEVRKFSDALVQQAIRAEIARNGQCFVLHNRVETIDAFAHKLRELAPGISFVVAHGQLDADELEDRVLEFKEGRAHVLVSSTIIENGIDLPRANTLIVNEAERFGLAQLYQLRGRVGRGKVQAYAYFLYHTQKLEEDAKKRLRAIVEACELGSGFQVAMRDLEIRGAGEILGVSQSGTMHTVGVSHYLRMLKSAVDELRAGRTEEAEEIQTVEILLPVEALIPPFYVPDPEEKISAYQKLAGCENEEVLKEFEQDLLAEYGPFPQPVKNLFAILRLKLTARRTGVPRVKMEEYGKKRDIVLTLGTRVTANEVMQLLRHRPAWRVSSSTLRIGEEEFRKHLPADDDWITALTADICHLMTKGKHGNQGKQEAHGG